MDPLWMWPNQTIGLITIIDVQELEPLSNLAQSQKLLQHRSYKTLPQGSISQKVESWAKFLPHFFWLEIWLESVHRCLWILPSPFALLFCFKLVWKSSANGEVSIQKSTPGVDFSKQATSPFTQLLTGHFKWKLSPRCLQNSRKKYGEWRLCQLWSNEKLILGRTTLLMKVLIFRFYCKKFQWGSEIWPFEIPTFGRFDLKWFVLPMAIAIVPTIQKLDH